MLTMTIAVEEALDLETIASLETVQIDGPRMGITGFYLMLNEILGGRFRGTIPIYQRLNGEDKYTFLGDLFYQPSEAGLMKGAYIFAFTRDSTPIVKGSENNIVLGRHAKKEFGICPTGILLREENINGTNEWIIGFPEYLAAGKEHQISTLIQNMYS
jgi:hypothetical protein